MLQTFKKVLANSEPSTHGGIADMGAKVSQYPLKTQNGRLVIVTWSAWNHECAG
jgi:hypothetical protein